MTEYNRKNIRMLASAFHIVGMLLIMEGLFMLISTIPSIYEIAINSRNYIIAMETKALKVLCFCSIITFTCGFMLYYFTKKQSILIDKRTGFLVVTLVWIVFSIFGSMPYILGGYITNITDAYFETMSGFTTTGASILQDVEVDTSVHGVVHQQEVILQHHVTERNTERMARLFVKVFQHTILIVVQHVDE